MVSDTLDGIVQNPNPWIQSYFHGERGNARLRERVALAGGEALAGGKVSQHGT
jgi:hypothetical protein